MNPINDLVIRFLEEHDFKYHHVNDSLVAFWVFGEYWTAVSSHALSSLDGDVTLINLRSDIVKFPPESVGMAYELCNRAHWDRCGKISLSPNRNLCYTTQVLVDVLDTPADFQKVFDFHLANLGQFYESINKVRFGAMTLDEAFPSHRENRSDNPESFGRESAAGGPDQVTEWLDRTMAEEPHEGDD